MADWTEVRRALTVVLAGLGPSDHLLIKRESPEVRIQLAVTEDGSRIRCEVSNESGVDSANLRERGWTLIDDWSGVWRRSLTLPASAEYLGALVDEAVFVVSLLWGQRSPDGFGYLAWRETAGRAWWEFWKPARDTPLKLPALGLPAAPEPDPNR